MPAKKILILAANPKGTTRRRLDEEVREIGEGLARSKQRDQFELKPQWAVRPRDIQRAMLDETPQIVHFSGQSDEAEGLIFEDEVGNPQFVDGAALAGLFSLFSDLLECVVLNGCYSETQAQAIAQHIPYVIGMNRSIDDKAAIAFAVGFYDALGAGRSVEFAYKLGCSAIQLAGLPGHDIPVLISSNISSNAIKTGAASSVTPSVASTMPANSPSSSTELSDEPIEVFVSYSHKDEDLREELDAHLATLKRLKQIKAWNDRAIEGGEEWDAAIKAKLESARIILLLISSRFLNSEYCYDKEMQRAMQRHDEGTARVIPIILKPCVWKGTPFEKLKVLPKDGKAITTWSNQDEAFVDVVQGIRRAVESLKK